MVNLQRWSFITEEILVVLSFRCLMWVWFLYGHCGCLVVQLLPEVQTRSDVLYCRLHLDHLPHPSVAKLISFIAGFQQQPAPELTSCWHKQTAVFLAV